MHFS
jgi:hypothetical protein